MIRYEEWKKWPEHEFLTTSDTDTLYFQCLMRKFRIRDGSRILEIGFGNGNFLGFALSKGFLVAGIETNSLLIERAEKAGVRCFDSIRSVEPDSLDAIFLFDVLEHINQDSVPDFLADLERTLKPAGRVIIRSPNGHSPLGLSNQHGDLTHVTIVTLPKLEFWISKLRLRTAYGGWDLTPIQIGNPFSALKTILRIILMRTIEKTIRIVFKPQPSGLLSSNLLICLERSN